MRSDTANVLVVDDDPVVCDLIQASLVGIGLKCLLAADAREAVAYIARRWPGVVVCDIAMPGLTGLDLLAHARRVAPACRVILMASQNSTADLAGAISWGAWDYLHKPFGPERLIESVRRAIADKHQAGVQALGLRAAQAMQTVEHYRDVSLQSVQALVKAVEAKDPYTRRHSEQVRHYAVQLAGHLGLPPERIESVRTAALLHDIGKIGIPDSVLTKPAKLTDEEFALIRKHPLLGAEILENIAAFREEARFVKAHHERWDGLGYPMGLAGEAIPLEARIIGIADALDAMLMKRTYKQAYPLAQVIEELSRNAGRQFEPALVGQTLDWINRNPSLLILPAQSRQAV